MTTSDLIFGRRNSDDPAIRTSDMTWSYAELDDRVAAAATRFRRSGVEYESRIAVHAHRTPETIVDVFAILRLGAVAVLLDPKAPAERVNHMCAVAGVEHDLSPSGDLSVHPEIVPVEDVDRGATVVFTSGSTGCPKAALHSFANHLYSAIGAGENVPLRSTDSWLLSLPIHHVGGLAVLFRCFLAGATVVIPSRKNSLVQAAQELGATHLSCVPTQLRRLLGESEVVRLRAIMLGGARVDPQVVASARDKGYPVFVTYGCTEMASQICTGSETTMVGRPLTYRQLRLADDGEILVRGETLFKGYLSSAGIDPARDDQGWYHTGDLGEWRTDELTILSRKDTMFVSGGESVFPEEIERALVTVSGVTDAVVVSCEDSEYDHRPVAFLAGDWDERNVRAELIDLLPSFMIPDRFLPLPETNGLKPKRVELQKLARIGPSGHPSQH